MNRLLEFLSQNMNYLWTAGRFRIDGSRGDTGSAAIYLSSASVRVMLSRDRGEEAMSFTSTSESALPLRWYDADVVLRALGVADAAPSRALTPDLAAVIERHLDTIEASFGGEEWGRMTIRLDAEAEAVDRQSEEAGECR